MTEEEKQLIFTLKHLHRLNNSLGRTNEHYSDFIEDMTSYYKNILMEFNTTYAEKNQNQ